MFGVGKAEKIPENYNIGVTDGFGLMFYREASLWDNARWYDPALGRFAQADSIIPLQSQGVQAWDRFAYTSNNPVRYTDPTGHMEADEVGGGYCTNNCGTYDTSFQLFPDLPASAGQNENVTTEFSTSGEPEYAPALPNAPANGNPTVMICVSIFSVI